MERPNGEDESARERAGEEGEYHHSRNLMKKIVVGSRSLRESRSKRGDLRRAWRRDWRIDLGGILVVVKEEG